MTLDGAVMSIHHTLILFPSSDGKKHKEKGVKPFLSRQEPFWKSISDSIENRYRHA